MAGKLLNAGPGIMWLGNFPTSLSFFNWTIQNQKGTHHARHSTVADWHSHPDHHSIVAVWSASLATNRRTSSINLNELRSLRTSCHHGLVTSASGEDRIVAATLSLRWLSDQSEINGTDGIGFLADYRWAVSQDRTHQKESPGVGEHRGFRD